MSDVTPHSVLEKFEFYFLSLIFTLLVASIQTAKHINNFNISFELAGWICLTISGLFGLSKIEYLPAIISLRNNLDKNLSHKAELIKAKKDGFHEAPSSKTGETINFEEAISHIENEIIIDDKNFVKMGKWHGVKHNTQKYAFIIGLLCIIISRTFLAFTT